jgi:hypothetical protein
MKKQKRFWVVGGDYTCVGFKEIKAGAHQMLGPFATRDEASRAWRRLSTANSSRATTRFSIAAESISLPA